jgi:hypothetical protein
MRFADVGGNGCITCQYEQSEDRRTKKRFHGESLLFFSFEIFWVKPDPWWCIPGILKCGLSIHFIPNFSMLY